MQPNLIISSNQSLDFKREMFPQTFPNQIHPEVTRLVFRHYNSLDYQLYTRVLLRLRQWISTHPKVSSYPTFYSCFSYFWGEVQCKDDWTGMRMSISSMFTYHLKSSNLICVYYVKLCVLKTICHCHGQCYKCMVISCWT